MTLNNDFYYFMHDEETGSALHYEKRYRLQRRYSLWFWRLVRFRTKTAEKSSYFSCHCSSFLIWMTIVCHSFPFPYPWRRTYHSFPCPWGTCTLLLRVYQTWRVGLFWSFCPCPFVLGLCSFWSWNSYCWNSLRKCSLIYFWSFWSFSSFPFLFRHRRVGRSGSEPRVWEARPELEEEPLVPMLLVQVSPSMECRWENHWACRSERHWACHLGAVPVDKCLPLVAV